jgi:DtxR family Mn-dependent transcriptional regulator
MLMIEYSSGRKRVTPAQEDYLKALFRLGGRAGPVATSELARHLGIAPGSVSEMVSRLTGLGLVTHDRSRGQQLTADGERIALELVRHHRLLEMFLVRVLGFGWDEVHEEAERLEHAISERMEERIFELLGRPELDPHGDVIPSIEGTMAPTSDLTLDRGAPGERLRVSRVSDEDPGKLRVIRRMGLVPGTELTLLAASEYEGPITVEVGGRTVDVPLGLARVIYTEASGGG